MQSFLAMLLCPLRRSFWLTLCSVAALGAATLLPATDTAPLNIHRRPVSFELNGEWIGNAVSFSPYRDGQGPEGGLALPSEEEIAADLHLAVRYWKLLRMYDSTVVTERTLRVIQRDHLPMKVIVGAWVSAEIDAKARAANEDEVARAIKLANAYPDQVLAVSVGNEACVEWSGHRTDPAVLIRLIRTARTAIKQPVTCADDYMFWNKDASHAIAAELDFIILHAYALWRGQPLEHAGDWLAARYDEATQFHPGIPIIIGETGWATKNNPSANKPGQEGELMKAEASDAAQLSYLRQHFHWLKTRRVPTFLFEAFDENWKGGGVHSSPDAAEKHWGVFTAARQPKPAWQQIEREFYGRK